MNKQLQHIYKTNIIFSSSKNWKFQKNENNENAYARNLGQHSILARKRTFLEKRAPKVSKICGVVHGYLYQIPTK